VWGEAEPRPVSLGLSSLTLEGKRRAARSGWEGALLGGGGDHVVRVHVAAARGGGGGREAIGATAVAPRDAVGVGAMSLRRGSSDSGDAAAGARSSAGAPAGPHEAPPAPAPARRPLALLPASPPRLRHVLLPALPPLAVTWSVSKTAGSPSDDGVAYSVGRTAEGAVEVKTSYRRGLRDASLQRPRLRASGRAALPLLGGGGGALGWGARLDVFVPL
jgi:hypothetical protein